MDSPDFTDVVLDHMGRGSREEFYRNEDGERWETIRPDVDDYQAAAQEAAHIRAELETRGLIPRRARGQALDVGFTSPSPSSRTEPRPDPDLDPPPL